MKTFLLKFTLLTFLILQSCLSNDYNNGKIDALEIDVLQILRDGTKIDTSVIDSCAITLDTIISRENKDCKKLKSI